MEFQLQFRSASDQSLLVSFGDAISLETHRRVVAFVRMLERLPVDGVINVHPAYCSVLVKFNALRWTHLELAGALRDQLAHFNADALPESRTVEIPVCYEGEFAPDLPELCRLRGLTVARAIAYHTSVLYSVYFLGFVPGFAYLGGLPAELSAPRLTTPRRAVPAGSVGIAAAQTGVYPFATPGGWRLIGRTPMKLFQADDVGKTGQAGSALAIGDRVKFVAIPPQKFSELERAWR
jgi:inhibitor of KinA